MAKGLVNLDPQTGYKWRVNIDSVITVVTDVVWSGVTCGTEKCETPDGKGHFYCIGARNVRTVYGIADDVIMIFPEAIYS